MYNISANGRTQRNHTEYKSVCAMYMYVETFSNKYAHSTALCDQTQADTKRCSELRWRREPTNDTHPFVVNCIYEECVCGVYCMQNDGSRKFRNKNPFQTRERIVSILYYTMHIKFAPLRCCRVASATVLIVDNDDDGDAEISTNACISICKFCAYVHEAAAPTKRQFS